MMLIVGVVLLTSILLSGNVVSGAERQLFKNVLSAECPHGIVFRAGCTICFCIELRPGQVVTKCKSKFTEKVCAAVAEWSHCEGYNLSYDYKEECEGTCKCNAAKNITICENLPCDDTLLWFHGYYNVSEKGQPVSLDDVNVMEGNEVDEAIDDPTLRPEVRMEDSRSKRLKSKSHQGHQNTATVSGQSNNQSHKSADNKAREVRSLGTSSGGSSGSKNHGSANNGHKPSKHRSKNKSTTTTTTSIITVTPSITTTIEDDVTHRPKRRKAHSWRSKRDASGQESVQSGAGDDEDHMQ